MNINNFKIGQSIIALKDRIFFKIKKGDIFIIKKINDGTIEVSSKEKRGIIYCIENYKRSWDLKNKKKNIG